MLNTHDYESPRNQKFTKAAGNAKASEAVLLRDGTQVSIRPIRPDDASGLQGLFNRLSQQSIFFRFLGIRKVLTDQEAKRLAEVDYQKQMALVAISDQDGGVENIIAVARYDDLGPAEPETVEVAVVVEDQYQDHGLGFHLLKKLAAYARPHNIHAFAALVHNENTRILRIIKQSELPVERKIFDHGVWEIRVNLRNMPEELEG